MTDLVAKNPDPNTVRVLIDAGIAADTSGFWVFTLLMYAAYRNTADVVSALIEAGAEVDARTDLAFTPLIIAVRHNRDAAVVRGLC